MHAFSYGPLVKMTKILQKLKKIKIKLLIDGVCLSCFINKKRMFLLLESRKNNLCVQGYFSFIEVFSLLFPDS